jgi:hypothetical protein
MGSLLDLAPLGSRDDKHSESMTTTKSRRRLRIEESEARDGGLRESREGRRARIQGKPRSGAERGKVILFIS